MKWIEEKYAFFKACVHAEGQLHCDPLDCDPWAKHANTTAPTARCMLAVRSMSDVSCAILTSAPTSRQYTISLTHVVLNGAVVTNLSKRVCNKSEHVYITTSALRWCACISIAVGRSVDRWRHDADQRHVCATATGCGTVWRDVIESEVTRCRRDELSRSEQRYLGAAAAVGARSGAVRCRYRRQRAQYLRLDAATHAKECTPSGSGSPRWTRRTGRIRHDRLPADTAAGLLTRVQVGLRCEQRGLGPPLSGTNRTR